MKQSWCLCELMWRLLSDPSFVCGSWVFESQSEETSRCCVEKLQSQPSIIDTFQTDSSSFMKEDDLRRWEHNKTTDLFTFAGIKREMELEMTWWLQQTHVLVSSLNFVSWRHQQILWCINKTVIDAVVEEFCSDVVNVADLIHCEEFGWAYILIYQAVFTVDPCLQSFMSEVPSFSLLEHKSWFFWSCDHFTSSPDP